MDVLTAINKVTVDMGISSRTLRYWEYAGLFTSVRDQQSGWRMYDAHALQCIRVTDLLRRLDLSVSEIKKVLADSTIDSLCHALKTRLATLKKNNDDLEALKTVITEIIGIIETESSLNLLSLENILLPVSVERKKHVVSKLQGGFSMESVSSKYNDIQIINLPSARTVAFSCVGKEPEDEAHRTVKKWIVKNNLQGTARVFGFNVEPYPTSENPEYGFGFCATIPEGIEIPKPLYEMRLQGGTYAVVSQYEGNPSYGWKRVQELCNDTGWGWEYDNSRNPGLEEHIELAEGGFIIPVLFPVKKK